MRALAIAVLVLLSSPAAAETIRSADEFGCATPVVLLKLREYARQKDGTAIAKLLVGAVRSGECIKFANGETVHAMRKDWDRFLVRLRRPGDLKEWWASMTAVWTIDQAKVLMMDDIKAGRR